MKPKWVKLINHFTRFVDQRWYPNYTPSSDACEAFIKVQSYGQKSLTETERNLVVPLMEAQELKEITLKGLVSEMADFWSKDWGWVYPLNATIDSEFKTRHSHKDVVFIKALISIARNCHKDGFDVFLQSFTGLSQDEKDKYFRAKFARVSSDE